MTRTVSIGDKRLRIEEGDITRIEADVIVNAANAALAGGGGVDGAIHRAAGPEVMRELDGIRERVGRCDPGQAVATGAGRLRASYIFHAVGPIYRGGSQAEAETLASCYRVCLRMAAERQAKSIAFPAISTGIYGYPLDEAARIAIGETVNALRGPTSVEEVRIVLFGSAAYQAFEHALAAEANGDNRVRGGQSA